MISSSSAFIFHFMCTHLHGTLLITNLFHVWDNNLHRDGQFMADYNDTIIVRWNYIWFQYTLIQWQFIHDTSIQRKLNRATSYNCKHRKKYIIEMKLVATSYLHPLRGHNFLLCGNETNNKKKSKFSKNFNNFYKIHF